MPPQLPVRISPGRDVTSGADGTYLIIQNGYSRGRPHQWGTELWRNGVQAIDRSTALRGDEQVVFDFVPLQFVDGQGGPLRSPVWKRRIWNDGPRMTPTELVDYFSSLSKGAGSNRFSLTNLAGQYGHGSRFAVLPHSDMFIATTEPGGGTEAVLIHDGGDKYSLSNFIFPNRGTSGERDDLAVMAEDCYLDLDGNRYLWMEEDDLIHPTVIQNGGVTTILMGLDMLDHYIDGDPNRGESSRGLVDDLTKWINSPVPVQVTEIRKSSKGGNRTGKQIRLGGSVQWLEEHDLKSYDDWFNRVPIGNQTTIELHNPDGGVTEVDVYLLPEDWNWTPISAAEAKKLGAKAIEHNGQWYKVVADQDQWFPWRGQGFVVYGYDYEMIPLYDTIPRAQQLKNWYVNVPAVADRTAIVVRPPKLSSVVAGAAWGVQQTGSRGTLLGPNESALPVDDWTNEFYDLLQNSSDLDFLRKALDDAQPAVTRTISIADLARVQEEMEGRMDLGPIQVLVKTRNKTGVPATETDVTIPVPDGGGTGPTTQTPNPRPRPPRSRKRVIPDPNGSVLGSPVKAPSAPDWLFVDAQEWADKLQAGESEYTPNHYCVMEIGGAGTTLWFNRGHEIYVGQHTHYATATGFFKETGQLPKFHRFQPGVLAGMIEDSYGILGVGLVFYAARMSRKTGGGLIDWKEVKRLCDSERLTWALGSYVNVDAAIRERIKNARP